METGREYPSWYAMEWRAWPIAWGAVWVGALAALTVGLIIGLIGFAVGAHESSRLMRWSNVKFLTLVFNVAGAFFAFVVGGWAGTVVGLSSINGSDASENETTQYEKLDTNKWYAVRVRVAGGKVECWLNDGIQKAMNQFNGTIVGPADERKEKQ